MTNLWLTNWLTPFLCRRVTGPPAPCGRMPLPSLFKIPASKTSTFRWVISIHGWTHQLRCPQNKYSHIAQVISTQIAHYVHSGFNQFHLFLSLIPLNCKRHFNLVSCSSSLLSSHLRLVWPCVLESGEGWRPRSVPRQPDHPSDPSSGDPWTRHGSVVPAGELRLWQPHLHQNST